MIKKTRLPSTRRYHPFQLLKKGAFSSVFNSLLGSVISKIYQGLLASAFDSAFPNETRFTKIL